MLWQSVGERLIRGDPDMAPDEIQAAIERAEAKARELQILQREDQAGSRV